MRPLRVPALGGFPSATGSGGALCNPTGSPRPAEGWEGGRGIRGQNAFDRWLSPAVPEKSETRNSTSPGKCSSGGGMEAGRGGEEMMAEAAVGGGSLGAGGRMGAFLGPFSAPLLRPLLRPPPQL